MSTQDVLSVKLLYRCGQCHWLYSWSYHERMILTDSPLMPCQHRWSFLERGDLEHAEPPEAQEKEGDES